MAKRTEEKEYFKLGEWEVKNVRDLDFGTFFTLQTQGLSLYNLRVVPAGKNYPAFIGMPEEKGKDGSYYKLFKIYLDPEDVAEIIAEVEKQANKKRR